MRIGMFLDKDFPPDARVEREAIALIEDGHHVAMFSLSYQSPERHSSNHHSIAVEHYPAGKITYKLSALAADWRSYHRRISGDIKDFLTTVNPDVVHIHDMVIARPVIDECKKSNIPMVLDLHENRPEIMKYYHHVKTFPGNILVSINRWRKHLKALIDDVNYVIVVTREAKEQLGSDYHCQPEKIIVVPNSLDPRGFESTGHNDLLPDGFNVLYVGDTGLRRGTDTALRAIKELAEQIKDLNFTLVGSNTEDKYLVGMVQEMDIGSRVHFEGWQPEDHLPDYIAGSDVCISPLKRNPHHDTTYANKIFQYMAMGKPQVVSDCPAQANLIMELDCGLVFKAGDHMDMAQKIRQLYDEKELSGRLGENGKNAVNGSWNWKNVSKELTDLYRNL